MSLNKEQILSTNDITIVKVPVPEWGGDVYVQTLKAKQIDGLSGLQQRELRTRLLIMTMVDENGASLGFTADDIPALEEKSLSAVVRVFHQALIVNGMTKEAVEVAKGN
jgi:hypothetical protein